MRSSDINFPMHKLSKIEIGKISGNCPTYAASFPSSSAQLCNRVDFPDPVAPWITIQPDSLWWANDSFQSMQVRSLFLPTGGSKIGLT